MKNTLTIKDLKYSYDYSAGQVNVLKGVSAEFHSGKLYAIQGESGSGKTTLLSLLAGLDAVQEGDVQYNGKSITKIGSQKYRLKYSNIVFQSYNLLKYMTARENVQIAIDFSGKKTDAYKPLAEVGLNKEESDRLIQRLSGGQQQRVAIARALAASVPIILADEPTGNLDEDTEEKIIALFKKLAHEDNIIVIVVTHSRRVASHCDKIFRLSRGLLK